MSDFKNFDPLLVIVTWRGIQMLGPMDGTFVKVARAEDAFKMHVGAQGDVTRVRNRNKTGSVTVTLTQSSPTNDLLSAAVAEDEAFGTAIGAVMIKDLQGTTLVEGAFAWIRKPTDTEYGADAQGREWTIDVAEILMFVGGAVR